VKAISFADRVCGAIEQVWETNGKGLPPRLLDWVTESARQSHSLRLPLLTCRAGGGDDAHAVPVAAAWHLLHAAAHLLDDVADGAAPDLDPNQAVNGAVALVFLSQLSLVRLRQGSLEPQRIVALVDVFNAATTRMSSGQAIDLGWGETRKTLDDYWRLVGAKAGAFFALACRAGAMLGALPQSDIDTYATFGYHFGILVQLSDDLRAIWMPRNEGDLETADRTLPVVYAVGRQTSPSETRSHLRSLVRRSADDTGALAELQRTLADLEALHYVTLQAGRHRHRACRALYSVARPAVTQRELLQILDGIFPALTQEG
jgi:competence protein ComQ